ncbi:UDP-glucose/GDP-mannose dehydrogenase family protein [Salipaludibacillus sp. LMS25]|jgi:UDPglucose 6-dehydrogenase|uniref:UDP-glucose dehydrogenase family protein n=1 Tax=Salipaludibacillus sp. LMS25 TaxID=2924031 RepID=UPI0020D05495|nr:UDP-glucose/GDP-mannose dehydrogenase family protein [Salipaludibacillus sp. LMS25]UTR16181.1 UDP-glucose/GDP-mannose dehydrogenase family protein [Salipaludibacillus sp. LMS25]
MKKIAVVGTGYVGLVTGVALSDIGHDVTCIDIDENKVKRMKGGLSPIYEPGLDDIMARNINAGRLHFTTSHQEGFNGKDVIYIAVGTPEKEDGTADLRFIDQVAADIATHLTNDVVIVTKSTVPVGTNDYILKTIRERLTHNVMVNIVSNPEFLREGCAVHDAFHGDRIVIGADSEEAGDVIEEINKPFGIQVYRTDVRSAEMIKYASNAFLATKISFINEIANICEKVGANIEDVATGMGMDDRIGSKFLNAGIGYGGSCFPKDTKALAQIAANNDHHFELLESVIRVNNQQHSSLTTKAKTVMGTLKGKKIALLGLAFKPNTDDMRESPAIAVSSELLLAGAHVTAYDPIAIDNAKRVIPEGVSYVTSAEEALQGADAAFIITDWPEFKELNLNVYKEKMATPLLFDGRNCYDLNTIASTTINYYSIGRAPVENGEIKTIS